MSCTAWRQGQMRSRHKIITEPPLDCWDYRYAVLAIKTNSVPTLSPPVQSALSWPNNVPRFLPPPTTQLQRTGSFLFLKQNFCSPPVSTLGQHDRQNEGHTEMPDFAVSTSSSCLCRGKSVIQQLLVVWWFSRPFQEFLCLKWMMIQMTDSVGAGWEKKLCFVESRAGRAIQQRWFIQGEMERHVILQSALILWDLDIWGGGGWGGGGGEGRRVLAVKVFTTSTNMRHV